jgi:hypothetical protein
VSGSGTSGPLRAVLAAFENGSASLNEVAERTSLPRDVVDAAIDHLVRMGRLSAKQLASGCPTGGCGSCASGSHGQAGCGAPGPSTTRSGPVLVALTISSRA